MTESPALLIRGIAAILMRPMLKAAILAAVPCLARVLSRRRRVRRRRSVIPALLVGPVCLWRLLVAIPLPVLGLAVLRRRCAGGRAWYLPVLAVRCVLLLLALVAMLSFVLSWRRRKARAMLGRVVGGGCARGLGVVGGLGVVSLRRRLVLRGCAWRLVCGGRRGATVGSCLAGIRVSEVLVLQRGGYQLVYTQCYWHHMSRDFWRADVPRPQIVPQTCVRQSPSWTLQGPQSYAATARPGRCGSSAAATACCPRRRGSK